MSRRNARLLISAKCPHCGDEIIIIIDKTQAKKFFKSFKMPKNRADAYLRNMHPVRVAPGRKRERIDEPDSGAVAEDREESKNGGAREED